MYGLDIGLSTFFSILYFEDDVSSSLFRFYFLFIVQSAACVFL